MTKYFAVNEEIEKEIKTIRREIMLSMNGICAETIDNSGLKYAKNYGVTLARLHEIAAIHKKNYDVAERLWLMSIRETKILATQLCPPDEMTPARLKEWLPGIETEELAEIISFELLRKAPQIKGCILAMELSDNELHRCAAYHTLARITNILDDNEKTAVMTNIRKADMTNISAKRAIETLTFNITGDLI